jgi:hypothetical protein
VRGHHDQINRVGVCEVDDPHRSVSAVGNALDGETGELLHQGVVEA